MIDLKKEIKLAFSENKLAICVATAILVVTLIAGYFLEPYLNASLQPVVDNLSDGVKSGDIPITFQSIFSNNLKIVLVTFLCGILFCFSAVILAYNGLFIGFFTATQDNLLLTLLLLVPHGIFELPSCIIACASGFVLFNFFYRLLKTWYFQDESLGLRKGLYESYMENFDKLKQAFLLLGVSIVLMIIAGIVEVYFTTAFADYIMKLLYY